MTRGLYIYQAGPARLRITARSEPRARTLARQHVRHSALIPSGADVALVGRGRS